MPSVIKINSKLGMVSFTKEDLLDCDLYRWIRTDSKGIGHRNFIDQQPFEKAASHFFHKEYPSHTVKMAEKSLITSDGTVDVFLRIAANISKGYYNSHPTKLTFSKSKGTRVDPNSEDYIKMYEIGEKDASVIRMKDLREVVAEFFDDKNILEDKKELAEDDEDNTDFDNIISDIDLDIEEELCHKNNSENIKEDFKEEDNNKNLQVVLIKSDDLDNLDSDSLEDILQELSNN